MELDDHVFLEELLALRREPNWEHTPTEITDFYSNAWAFDYYFDQNTPSFFPNSSSEPLSAQNLDEFHHPLTNEFSVPEIGDSAMELAAALPFQAEVRNAEREEEEKLGFVAVGVQSACKLERNQSPEAAILPDFNIGTCSLDRKNRSKKLQGQPSKNLMAERRRRKRLNDRLAMLRSIVPKISKMDRTAILADAIEYVKELLEKVGNGSNVRTTNSIIDRKSSEFVARNSSPKFEVERRNGKTRMEICCAAKPGLLLSTVNTIEALGLDIQHCVISCFSDFALQATCSQERKPRTELKPEELKEALFRNAGYGGSC